MRTESGREDVANPESGQPTPLFLLKTRAMFVRT